MQFRQVVFSLSFLNQPPEELVQDRSSASFKSSTLSKRLEALRFTAISSFSLIYMANESLFRAHTSARF